MHLNTPEDAKGKFAEGYTLMGEGIELMEASIFNPGCNTLGEWWADIEHIGDVVMHCSTPSRVGHYQIVGPVSATATSVARNLAKQGHADPCVPIWRKQEYQSSSSSKEIVHL